MLHTLLIASTFAQVDPKCEGKAPDPYDEQTQQDFLSNYFALATTLSPIHGPIPHDPGRGAIGVDLLVIPPLSCKKRFVLEGTKTEDTNKTPIGPRPRVTFAFDAPGGFVPYAGVAYMPPLPVAGTRNVAVGSEFGIGRQFGEHFQFGLRFHAQMFKTVADIATAFNENDPAVDDLFISSTFGGDAILGWHDPKVTPYLAVGMLDASTFFFVGDDGYASNNYHPYAGPAFSLGADGLVAGKLRWGGEFYGAPGGYSMPDEDREALDPKSRYGRIYTARFRIALEL
jgi:hypothetical protein